MNLIEKPKLDSIYFCSMIITFEINQIKSCQSSKNIKIDLKKGKNQNPPRLLATGDCSKPLVLVLEVAKVEP